MAATIIVGGVVVTAAVAGTGAVASAVIYRKYKKRARLKGNKLFSVSIDSILKEFKTEENIPYIIELCCEQIEAREKHIEISWQDLLSNIEIENIEDNNDLLLLIGKLSVIKTQRKVNLNETILQNVIHLLAYYLYTLPDPLFLYENYIKIILLQKEYEKTNSLSIWRDTIVDMLFELSDIRRLSILRILRMCNWVLSSIHDDCDSLLVAHKFAELFASGFLRKEDNNESDNDNIKEPTNEELQEIELVIQSITNLILNYSSIISSCAHRKFMESQIQV